MEVLKALQTLGMVDLKPGPESERMVKIKALRVVDEQLTQPLLRTTAEFDNLLEFAVFALLRMLQDSDMNVWSLAEQVLVKTVKVLETTHRDKIVAQVWRGVKGSKVEGRSRRFSIELFSLYAHRIKPSNANKFREALLRNLVSIARQEDDQLLQEALSKCIDPIITHQLAHAPLADLDPFLDELAANVRSQQSRVRRSAVACIVALCKGHKQHLDIFVASIRRMLNLILWNFYKDSPITVAQSTLPMEPLISFSNDPEPPIEVPPTSTSTSLPPAEKESTTSLAIEMLDSEESFSPKPAPAAALQEIPIDQQNIRKAITDLDIVERLPLAVSKSSSATLQGSLHAFRQLLRLNHEFVQVDVYAMPNPMNADVGTFCRIASQCLKHDDTNVTVAALELMQEIFEHHWQPLVQLGGTGYPTTPEKDEATAFVEDLVTTFEKMLFDSSLRISVQSLVIACLCALAVPSPIPLQECIKKRLPEFLALLKHTDPLLRGQAYLFIGSFVTGWLQSKSKIYWPELDVFEILGTVLHSTMRDDSAIAAKMACEGLSICTEPLLASEHAYFVPYMLQHLMCLPSDAYQLLKSKTFSLISKIDYRAISFLEKSMKKIRATEPQDITPNSSTLLHKEASSTRRYNSPTVRLPARLTIGQQKFQNSVVDFLISFLEDVDHRVRHKAGKVLVKMLPNLNYSHFFDTTERRQFVVALRILDMQTSQHMSDERNNEWKEHTDWLLWKLVPKINQAAESLFIKGFYHFLRILLENGYHLPGQLIGIMLDQLACSNLATDLDTQLDLFVMMSHLVKYLTGSLAQYSARVLAHILRIMHILSGILSGKPLPSFKENKSGSEKEGPVGAVQGQPQYLQLWERLQDSYRLSLTSLHGNMFDEFCVSAIKAVGMIVKAMGKGVVNFLDEILGYLIDHFERNTEEVLECLQDLLEAALSEVDLVHERSLPSIIEPLNAASEEAAVLETVHNIVDLTTPTYETLLYPVFSSKYKKLRTSSASLGRERSNSKNVGVPSLMPPAAIVKDKRRILKSFEPTLKRCIDHYLSTQAVHRRRTILQLLTHILATLKLVFPYRSLDQDASFVRQVHGHLMKTATLHTEISKSKTGQPTSSSPKVAAILGHSSDSLSQSNLPTTETALQLSEIAAVQLAFLLEMLFHCGIAWNGPDLITLIPVAFASSWQPSSNQRAFEDIANLLFTEHLLMQWRECPKEYNLSRTVPKPTDRSSLPAASVSNPSGTSSPAKTKSSGTHPVGQTQPDKPLDVKDWMGDTVLASMRNQFVTQLLMLIPDPRAINILSQVLDSLRNFSNQSPYHETSSIIHDGLITILLDESTTVLFAKSNIHDLLAMFSLLDSLPSHIINLNAIAATFVSIAKLSLHHLDTQSASNHAPSLTPLVSPAASHKEYVDPFQSILANMPTATAIPSRLSAFVTPTSTPTKTRSPAPFNFTAKPTARSLTPADLGIVSPLPLTPAHKEESLRERSKRRVQEYERRYYSAHDRAWLPRVCFLLRILMRFSESQILAALAEPIKIELSDLPPNTDLNQPSGVSQAFALLLSSLLARGSKAFVKAVSTEYYEDWTRQVCAMSHLIIYIVDSPFRTKQQEVSSLPKPSSIPASDVPKNPFEENIEPQADLLLETQSTPTFLLPESMKLVISSIELTTILYGAVQSKFGAVAFSLCKLFQNLNFASGLQQVLAFTSPDPVTSVIPKETEILDSYGHTESQKLSATLPWTWYREVLHMASFSAYCRVTSYTAVTGNLEERRAHIAELISSPANLERIVLQAYNSDIRRLFSLYPISLEQQSLIWQFIENKLSHNMETETLEPQDLHQLLLVTSYLPTTEQTLKILLKYFIKCPYISVVIATEQYFINLLSRLEYTMTPQPLDGTEPLETTVKRLLNEHKSQLRPSFLRKMGKSGWTYEPVVVLPSAETKSAQSAFSTIEPFDLFGLPNSSSANNSHSDTPHSDLNPRFHSGASPSEVIENLLMDYLGTRSFHGRSFSDILCASMSSRRLFKRVVGLPAMKPDYLKATFARPSPEVWIDILLELTSSIETWMSAHQLTLGEELNDMLIKLESEENIGRRVPKSRKISPESDNIKARISYPEDVEPPILNILSADWRLDIDLMRLVVHAMDRFPHELREATHPASSSLNASSNTTSALDLNHVGHTKDDDQSSFALLTPLVSSTLPAQPSSKEAAEPTADGPNTEEKARIRQYLGPAAIVNLGSISLKKLLHIHETKTAVLSTFDVCAVLSLLKVLFSEYHFSIEDLSSHPRLRKLIYRLYLVYFILFKPSKKLILDFTSSEQVPQVLTFFNDTVRTMAWKTGETETPVWHQAQALYNIVLQKLIQSSPSMEYAVFPLQDEPINFDSHNEPVRLLEQICYLVNTIHFNYSCTFIAVWRQLMEGCDPEIPSVATSEMIKLITVRTMSSMLLRAGHKAVNINVVPRSRKNAEKNMILEAPLLSIEALRANYNASPKFVGLELSNNLTVFLNSVLKPFLEPYFQTTTTEAAVGKESLKSLVLLSDHFTLSQWQWFYDCMIATLDRQPEVWDEDPLMRNYLLVGFAKATSVLWPLLQPKLPSMPAPANPALRLQKLIVHLINNIKLREAEIQNEDQTVMPVAKNLIIIAIHYIIQAKTIFDVKNDTTIWTWLDSCVKSTTWDIASATSMASAPDPKSSNSALIRFLAQTCQAMLAHQSTKESENRSLTQLAKTDEDFDMKHMEEIKTLFASVRSSPSAHADNLAKSVIPLKLMQYFSSETIVSSLLSELSKPDPGVQSIALVFNHVLLKLRETSADNLDDVLSRWVMMTLPHFTKGSLDGKNTLASWALCALFLASSRNPLLRTLFFELDFDNKDTSVDLRLFNLAGVDFCFNRDLSPSDRTEFINSFAIPSNPSFNALHHLLSTMNQSAVNAVINGIGHPSTSTGSETNQMNVPQILF